ncbi:MAG: DNA adenine methylase [candidate division WOR-3 bacterium]
MLRSPIFYAGGKGRMVFKLLKLIPSHKYYCEVFGGGASLLFAKPPAEVETYNDIDSNLVNLFRVIRDEEKFKKFHKLVSLTLYSREEFNYCRDTLDESKDDVERAYKFFIVLRQSMAGAGNGWGFAVKTSHRNMSVEVSKYLAIIDILPLIHERLKIVQIENDDFRKIIPRYDTEDTFFYCDPPYPLETRKNKLYKYELTLEDHKDLVNLLLKCKGKVMLSCYWHDVYQPLLGAGWRKKEFKTACHFVIKSRHSGLQGKGNAIAKEPRTEVVLMNYEIIKSLF